MVVRRFDDHLKLRLRVRAAQHGRSMEEEVRMILTEVLGTEPPPPPPPNLAALIRARVAPVGGVDLEIPARTGMREPPKF